MVADADTPQRPLSWRDRIRAWRAELIASAQFQDWALKFPLTRPFVRRKSAQLYDLVAGFVYSQTLYACVEVDLFRKLLEQPRAPQDIAPRLNLTTEAATRLLRAAAAIDLLIPLKDGRFAVSDLGAAIIGAPGVEEMIQHHNLFYNDISDPLALLRRQTDPSLARYWAYVGGVRTHAMSPTEAAPYSELMAASQAMVAAETLNAFPMSGYTHLTDIGGGEGAFLAAALAHHPHLTGTVFDLPAVAVRGRDRLTPFAGRGAIAQGSFLEDALPEGGDLCSLIRVCYDHEDDVVLTLLRKIHGTLPPGGTLLISEPMSGGDRPERAGDTYFAFYTAAMGTGRARSKQELMALLNAAGFATIRSHKTRQPFVTQVLSARKP